MILYGNLRDWGMLEPATSQISFLSSIRYVDVVACSAPLVSVSGHAIGYPLGLGPAHSHIEYQRQKQALWHSGIEHPIDVS